MPPFPISEGKKGPDILYDNHNKMRWTAYEKRFWLLLMNLPRLKQIQSPEAPARGEITRSVHKIIFGFGITLLFNGILCENIESVNIRRVSEGFLSNCPSFCFREYCCKLWYLENIVANLGTWRILLQTWVLGEYCFLLLTQYCLSDPDQQNWIAAGLSLFIFHMTRLFKPKQEYQLS